MNETLVAFSPVTKDLIEIVKKTAVTNSPVLFCGEAGSGRKTFANFSYQVGNKTDRSFYYFDCKKAGEYDLKNVIATCGTIFFDSIEYLDKTDQETLLAAIQSKVDVKILASTSEDLNQLVQNGSFLEDLFFRLNVFPVRIPPLRTRTEDIVPIAEFFIHKYSAAYCKNISGLSDNSKEALMSYSWPGNLNELDCVIERAVLLSKDGLIPVENLFVSAVHNDSSDEVDMDLEDKTLKNAINVFKRNYVIKILDECGWNQTKAGKVLGIQRTYVSRLMNELHIREK